MRMALLLVWRETQQVPSQMSIKESTRRKAHFAKFTLVWTIALLSLGFFSSHVPSWQITWRQGSEDAAMTQLERKDAIFVLTWERVTGRSFPISFISFQDLETEVWASSLATWLRKIRRNSWLWLGCFASIRWEQTKQLFSICLEDAKQLLGTWLLGGTGSLAVGVIFVDRSSPRSYLMTCSLLYWANEEKKQWSITPRKAFLSLINN